MKNDLYITVSVEYLPIKGGIGCYTYNLTKKPEEIRLRSNVACNEEGHGQSGGPSPMNAQNSDVLLKILDKLDPDIVHVQYEHGMYGLKLEFYKSKEDKYQYRFIV